MSQASLATRPRKAVIFVHGMRTSSAIWTEQLAHVARRGHQGIAIDLPAHGVRHQERFSLERSFDILDDTVASLPAGTQVLTVGLSLGGYTTLAWAARQPAQLAGVVAAACTTDPYGKPVHAYRSAADALVRGWTKARAMSGTWASTLTSQLFAQPAPGLLIDGNGPMASTKPPWSIVTDALGELAGQSWLHHVAQVKVPLLLVNGARDHLRLDERRYVATARNARLLVIPRAGHDVNSHAPAAFNRVLDLALSQMNSATLEV